MFGGKPPVEIFLMDIRINSIASNSGVFAGRNFQYLWRSDRAVQSGFGSIIGEGNTLESPYNVVTDPGSSSELIDYLEAAVSEKMGKRVCEWSE